MNTPISFIGERKSRRSFTAADVVACVGVSYRQLDYWTRTGVISASSHPSSGTGDTRWYRDTDVIRVAVVFAMLQAGITLKAARAHLEQTLTDGQVACEHVTIAVDVDRIAADVDTYRRAAS